MALFVESHVRARAHREVVKMSKTAGKKEFLREGE